MDELRDPQSGPRGNLMTTFRQDEEDRDHDPNVAELGMIVDEQLKHLEDGSARCQHQIHRNGRDYVIIVLEGNLTETDFTVVPSDADREYEELKDGTGRTVAKLDRGRVGEDLGYGGDECGDLEDPVEYRTQSPDEQ